MVRILRVHVTGLALALGTGVAAAQGTGPNAEPGWDLPVHDDVSYARLLMERFEYQAGEGEDEFVWDGEAWFGGDTHRLLVQSEGEAVVSGGDGGELERLDVQYANRFSAYWDARAGIGYQTTFGSGQDRERASAVIGIQGLAPYWFEVDARLRVSEDGDTVVELESEYTWLFTQKLILRGRVESSYAFDEVTGFGVGEGINNLTMGLRLGYEVRRELTPYLGISWRKQYGDTADLTRGAGGNTERSTAIAGLRWWL